MNKCNDKSHNFRDNGGICINWTGAIGSYFCSNCLCTAKYGYGKSGDRIQILWIKDRDGEVQETNVEAIKEFGNREDRLLIGIRWSILKQEFAPVGVSE